jgi:hypothetical protein
MSEYQYEESAAVGRPLAPRYPGNFVGQIETINGRSRFDFSWPGLDGNDPVSVRGWLRTCGVKAQRRIFVHLGDDSGPKAERQA